MKKIIVLIALLVIGLENVVAQEGIRFTDLSWKQTLAKAELEDKLIFIDAYTDWCGPCKWMAKNAFTDEDVAAVMNKTFICKQIDMESDFGKKFDEVYEITAYPTLFFINADGDIVKRSVGALDAQQLLSLAKMVADPTLSPTYQLKVKYDAGDHSEELMEEYFQAVKDEDVTADTNIVNAYSAVLLKKYQENKTKESQEKYIEFSILNGVDITSSIVDNYIQKIENKNLIDRTPFITFYFYVDDFQHPLATYFAKNITDFREEWGENATDKFAELVGDAIGKYHNGNVKKRDIYEFFRGLAEDKEDFEEIKTYIDDELLVDDE
jgi:thiol-disulfide isomerase/thioredoxin